MLRPLCPSTYKASVASPTAQATPNRRSWADTKKLPRNFLLRSHVQTAQVCKRKRPTALVCAVGLWLTDRCVVAGHSRRLVRSSCQQRLNVTTLGLFQGRSPDGRAISLYLCLVPRIQQPSPNNPLTPAVGKRRQINAKLHGSIAHKLPAPQLVLVRADPRTPYFGQGLAEPSAPSCPLALSCWGRASRWPGSWPTSRSLASWLLLQRVTAGDDTRRQCLRQLRQSP